MTSLKTSLILAGLLACSVPFAQTTAPTESVPRAQAEKPVAGMSGEEKDRAEDRIEATAKADKKACEKLEGNAEDICEAQAKGKEKVAKAELNYQLTGKDSDRAKLADIKAEAEYEVAKERCEDQEGDAQRACKKQAKDRQDAAQAQARKTAQKN